ncbi:hypothetical protein ACFWXK_15430 [Streptomyces sp. NPDC059070]|uniref:hypothetical protein n=1 Tax=Streptomyces sp. NPDC059070 TaxID=3346713 RepID=UPI00369671C2
MVRLISDNEMSRGPGKHAARRGHAKLGLAPSLPRVDEVTGVILPGRLPLNWIIVFEMSRSYSRSAGDSASMPRIMSIVWAV